MEANKENARAARAMLADITEGLDDGADGLAVKFLREFLEAAERKLPSAVAYQRDRERSRHANTGGT